MIKVFWQKRRFLLLMIMLLFSLKDGLPDNSRFGRIKAQIAGYEFNYIAWELDALWQKLSQSLFGWQVYYTDAERKAAVIEYLQLTGQIFDHDAQIEAIYADPAVTDPESAAADLAQERDRLLARQRDLQPIVEPIIERHIEAVLIDEGFGTLGQVLPPVSFRFVETPDVLIVSPRDRIQQDYAISLRALTIAERSEIEQNVMTASPNDAAYITGVGGVGIWPAMVVETRWASIAYEIVAHEWSHHYLFAFPSGQEYLVRPESRYINETVATVFGNAMAIKVLERFYRDEVARGLIWIPDYPTLQDFFPPTEQAITTNPTISAPQPSATMWLQSLKRAEAAQWVLDSSRQSDPMSYLAGLNDPLLNRFDGGSGGVMINRTRITTDYLLAHERILAAEALMSAQGQALGLRVLNQAWFAFNGGYQADPSAGSGVALGPVVVDVTDPAYVGDPIGPAVHELIELAPTMADFLVSVRGATTREALLDALVEARHKWGPLETTSGDH